MKDMKFEYVKEAYEEFIKEAISNKKHKNPYAVKTRYLIEALADGFMDETEFNTLFSTFEAVSLA